MQVYDVEKSEITPNNYLLYLVVEAHKVPCKAPVALRVRPVQNEVDEVKP